MPLTDNVADYNAHSALDWATHLSRRVYLEHPPNRDINENALSQAIELTPQSLSE